VNASTGVLPLICVLCEQQVGVINTTALAEMLGSGEVYFCKSCAAGMHDPRVAQTIADYLETCPPSHYENLVMVSIKGRETNEDDDGHT
jgi:hypothetical protein